MSVEISSNWINKIYTLMSVAPQVKKRVRKTMKCQFPLLQAPVVLKMMRGREEKVSVQNFTLTLFMQCLIFRLDC